MIFPRLPDQLENRLGDWLPGNARGRAFAIEEGEIIERPLDEPSTPAQKDAVHLQLTRARRRCEFLQHFAKGLRVAGIFSAGLSLIRVVMPAVDEDDEQ